MSPALALLKAAKFLTGFLGLKILCVSGGYHIYRKLDDERV